MADTGKPSPKVREFRLFELERIAALACAARCVAQAFQAVIKSVQDASYSDWPATNEAVLDGVKNGWH